MPYSTEWIDPEVFIEHEGVSIYHTCKNCDLRNGPFSYWFTTNDDDSDEDYYFDVRDLRLFVSDPEKALDDGTYPPPLKEKPAFRELMNGPNPNEDEIIKRIIRTAIEQGLLKQNESYPAI